ncbi:MAG TPA: HAMP domain-containing sensor histidine kinase, partial [Nitrososphaeraceae archaeon]
QIYSEINQVLFIERIKMFSLLAGTSAAVVVLIVFLIKWSSSLDNEVRRRTRELKESNERLAFANEQLKVQERVQKEFINIAAHELRTPIQPILGLSEILRSRLSRGTGVEGQDLLDIIIRNAKRLQRLAEDILDVTRIESQSLRLKIEEFDLNEVVSYVVDDYRNQLQKLNTGSMTTDISDNKVKLVYTANKENILIEADKGRIIQVVSNLMSNAIKFTRQIRSEGENGLQSQEQVKEKTISVSVEKNDPQKEAIVSIRDTGLGIDPEILPRLFSKFASKSFEGTGLGLFISKSIIEAHGGKIWATNNDDTNNDGSKGATFYFSLVLTQKQHENVHARMDGR